MADPILVVGSLNMDQVVHVPRLPQFGETLLGAGSLTLAPGGKGANQAVAMAKLGGNVLMAGRIGHDAFGTQLLQSLRDNHIDTTLVEVDQHAASGTAFIFLGQHGENAIVVSPGTNSLVGEDQQHYRRILAQLDAASAIVMQMEIPQEMVQTLLNEAHQRKVMTVLNLAPAVKLPWDILRKVSLLVVNESEASLLSERPITTLDEAREVVVYLQNQGIETVVITLGDKGALLATNNVHDKVTTFYQEAPHVQVVDTTAAGDCFVGALTVALTERKTPEEALRFAVTASALKVTKFGAQPGLPRREEVERMIRTF
jgi:ribokinase